MNAPKLILAGDKFEYGGEKYYAIPHKLMEIVCKNFNNNAKMLLLLLIGSDNGFGLSVGMVTARTGLSQPNYHRTRKELINVGVLQHDRTQNTITLDFDLLRSLDGQSGVFKGKRK